MYTKLLGEAIAKLGDRGLAYCDMSFVITNDPGAISDEVFDLDKNTYHLLATRFSIEPHPYIACTKFDSLDEVETFVRESGISRCSIRSL